jgi:alpha-mannosidase
MLIWVSSSSSDYGISSITPQKLTSKLTAGRHVIRYAIFPHAGSLDHRTVRAAYNFNHHIKLLSVPTLKGISSANKILSAITLKGSPALILDCIKRGEDDVDVSRANLLPVRKGRSVILRIYDSLGGRSTGTICWDPELVHVSKVFRTNLLEDDEEELEMKVSREGEGESEDESDAAPCEVEVKFRPFEVATFRLQLSN